MNNTGYISLVFRAYTYTVMNDRSLNDPSSKWVFLKIKIRTHSLTYSKEKAKERRKNEDVLMGEISANEQKHLENEALELRAQLRNAQMM